MTADALRSWNDAQIRVLDRWSRIHHRPLTPEVVVRLAVRFAERHARERGAP